ncbi:hypothetical protein [Urbifossiella limnaea]|uniref:Uncharacterized protein n=1 Tax=Urbifossiella limnaea TaxID=2528023 RepID=A0A517XWJ1_9BACT|nr:hypothetical protein [Urbifossiella limnaea]QDU21881.1 hypothetical protein ETAA1_38540 [Urbifossiella limnaea]
MTDRRSLVDAIVTKPHHERAAEAAFVFSGKPPATRPAAPARAPLTTRIRADYAAALKRASLERQLAGVEPATVQEMLEEALGPWLKANGYLP